MFSTSTHSILSEDILSGVCHATRRHSFRTNKISRSLIIVSSWLHDDGSLHGEDHCVVDRAVSALYWLDIKSRKVSPSCLQTRETGPQIASLKTNVAPACSVLSIQL